LARAGLIVIMKKHFWHRGSILAALLALGMGSSVLNAADAPAAATPDAGGGGRGGRGGGGRGNFQGRGTVLALDDQQRQLFREALDKDRETLAKLNDKLQAAQNELLRATLAENFDEKVVAQKADAVGKIEAEIMVIQARAFSAVAPTLKPEQRQELENSRLGVMMLRGGFVGFGGGLRGGGLGGGGGRGPRGGGDDPAGRGGQPRAR